MTNSAPPDQEPAFIEVGMEGDRRRIAVRARAGGAPGLLWLGGFHSDMKGTKALALDEWAAAHGRACVRFDYSGHGESGGTFIDGTIGRWLEESVAVFGQFCTGPQVVIGSSMGGWMALLLAREIARNSASNQASRAWLAGLVLIAPAPDFTEELMWKGFSPEARPPARLANVRANSSAIQPPIDEPTTTCGPAQNRSNTATLSSSQRPMVPSAKAPPDSPWPE